MRPPARYPHVRAHARLLSVSPSHLIRVLDGERRGGRNNELLARYNALAAADPDGTKGVRVIYIPRNTTFADLAPKQLVEAAKEYGNKIRIEGTSFVTQASFLLMFHGEAGAQMQPAAKPASEATAAKR